MILWLNFLVGVIGLLFAILYCVANNSGHTGFSPAIGSFLFTPIVLIGIGGYMKRKASIAGRLSIIVGLSGLFFGFFIEHTGIMKEYSDWLHSGMNAQNPNADLLLIIYGCLVLFGCLVLLELCL